MVFNNPGVLPLTCVWGMGRTSFPRRTSGDSSSRAPAAVMSSTATYSTQAAERSLGLPELSVNVTLVESLRHVKEAQDRPKKAGSQYVVEARFLSAVRNSF